MLTDLEIDPFYRTSTHDLLRDFYLPCLEQATCYDRAVGFFTSHTLSLAARGVGRLAARGGRMRIVASPRLSAEDVAATRKGAVAGVSQPCRYELRTHSLWCDTIPGIAPCLFGSPTGSDHIQLWQRGH